MIGKKFEPNTFLSAWLSISIVYSLICKDVAASTLPTLLVLIAANLMQLPTDYPQSINQGVPCHAVLERLDFPWQVKAECFLLPSSFSNPYESSSYELVLAVVLKNDSCLFLFPTFFSSIEILHFHFPCPLLLPPPELDCPPYLVDFFAPFLLMRSLRRLSL